ncbi:MAG: hypothetical protein WDZ83_18400 [Rhizobiaceae bacterium]
MGREKAKPVPPARDHVQNRTSPLHSWLLGIIATGFVLVLLVEGRSFLIPLVVALLLFILITAMIDFVAALKFGPFRVPVWAATVATVVILAATRRALLSIVSQQMATVPERAPAYLDQMRSILIESLSWLGQDTANSVMSANQDVDVGSYLRTERLTQRKTPSGAILVGAVSIAVAVTCPSFSQDSAGGERGAAVVDQWCRLCHLRVDERPDPAMAPPFEELVKRVGRDRAFYLSFMAADHFPMTTFRLFDDEKRDVVEYLLSLQTE